MRKELVKEIMVNDEGNEGDLKKVKMYLSAIKSKFSKKYFSELKSNQNTIRKYTPVITFDAYNLLDATPHSIALKKIQNNSVVLMEVHYQDYQDDVIGKLSITVDKKKNKIKVYLEYKDKTSISPLLTIF